MCGFKMRGPKWILLVLSVVVIQCVAHLHATDEEASLPETVSLDTGGLSREKFPKGFVFGTATSACDVKHHQVGMAHKAGRGPSIWDTFVKIPGIVANNATGDVSVDQYHRYKEDVDIMAKLNFDAYRFSISWSRIFPNGKGKVNWEGVAYYNRHYSINANLYHYDLPLELEKKYKGLLSDQVVKDFADYADFCFKTFGDRVKNWMTFNEPRVVAALGYDNGLFAPGRCSKAFGNCTVGNSATEPYIAAHHHLILSHAAAVQRYREKYQEKQKGRIGILLDFVWYEPLTRSKADNLAAQRARDFHVGWFIHPIVYGEYPRTMQEIVGDRLPKFTKEEVHIVKGSIDFVGINQYTAYYMYDPHQPKPKVLGYQQDWNVGFACMDDPGNVTLSKGLHDTTRIKFYKGYLTQLKKAVDDGANVTGYFAWSLLDNFEWRSGYGYTSRFGIVYVNFKNLKRYPKMSAYWFKRLLQST
uniref:Beta-glucosidase n=1 Tax=Fagus sylvatica TaxID=28930 RepID=A0A2N9G1U1_FAGSY